MGAAPGYLATVPTVDPAAEKRIKRASDMAERYRQNRDAEIIIAFLDGAGLREIARAAGLTHQGVKKILERHAEDPSLVQEFRRREEHRERLNSIKRQHEREHRERQQRRGGPAES